LKTFFSLRGKFTLGLALLFLLSHILTIIISLYFQSWLLAVSLIAIVSLIALSSLIESYFQPIDKLLQALRGGIESFKDNDYSISILNNRSDELGSLISSYNELAGTLREERFGLFQRELLLDTIVQSSAVAVVIANNNQTIVFSNRVAKMLFNCDKPLPGLNLHQLAQSRSEALHQQTVHQRDGLFSIEPDDDGISDIYHLTCRSFNLNGQTHLLYIYKQLTREIARQEVETWKKVIRVISHELNNSLAPISSLSNSARIMLKQQPDLERLDDIFNSISNRSQHLHSFIENYARFARLPKPNIQAVSWQQFISQLQQLAQFNFKGDYPEQPGTFDPSQLEQALINLLKNASESGSDPDQINLTLIQNQESSLIAVEDRGPGLNEDQMIHAMLPFYSTKRSGSGLGLPLCREIIEAHGGNFQLTDRNGGGLSAICRLPLHKNHKNVS